jgi:hypothetical protein
VEASMEAGESRELGNKALGTKKLEAEYLWGFRCLFSNCSRWENSLQTPSCRLGTGQRGSDQFRTPREQLTEKLGLICSISKNSVVTQHTTACCSMQSVDITFVRYHFTNTTSLRVVQQKHSGLYSSTKYYKP